MKVRLFAASAVLALSVPLVASSNATPAMAAPAGAVASSALVELPAAVNPEGGVPAQPEGTTLIQVGFRSQLNYPFVVEQPAAAAQIFDLLPSGVAYGLGIEADEILVAQLRPLDTADELGYVTTIALLYIPAGDVEALRAALLNPGSPLHGNPNNRVATLISSISPDISLTPAPQPI